MFLSGEDPDLVGAFSAHYDLVVIEDDSSDLTPDLESLVLVLVEGQVSDQLPGEVQGEGKRKQ